MNSIHQALNSIHTYHRQEAKLGPEVIRRMILGGFVPSAGHAGKYFLKALKVKSKLITEINHVFGEI